MSYKISHGCGGLRYNTDYFKEIDGVITLADITSADNDELVGEPMLAPCGGQMFDDGVFTIVKLGDKNILTILDEDAEEPVDYFAANCSLLFDADVFELDDDKALSLIS